VSTRIGVTALGPGHFGLEISEGPIATNHELTLSDEVLEEQGLFQVDQEEMAREIAELLLERMPATAIRPRLTLDQLVHDVPDFWADLRPRLSGPPED
jgi:hypothetical protein